jgi:NAD(P)-dependent dehydrogenase (short-subunit alcohol dehydrogenase family)
VSTHLITGANRGIGLEFCRQLAARGDDVIAACRESSPELDGLGVRVETGMDVADAAAVADLAGRLAGTQLSTLVCNAGILKRIGLDELDYESIRRQFEVNAMGTLRTVEAFLGNLGKGSKIGIISSLMGSMADNGSGGHYGYRMSKAAVNAAGVSLAADLRPRGIPVAILHPGLVNTRMTGNIGMSTEESVQGLLALLDGLNLENIGTFLHSDGRVLPW